MYRVYYGDGSTSDGDELEPYGVVVILQKTYGRYHITHGSPYYVYDGEEWLPCWMNDIEDYLAHGIPIKKFLIGRIVSKEAFTDIFEQAKKDRALEALG